MSQRPPREYKILEFLGTHMDGTFEEIFRATKMGRKSLYLGTKKLQTEGIVKRDSKTKRYYLRSESKNDVLLFLRKKERMRISPKRVEELKEADFPFEKGYAFLKDAMYTLQKLGIGRYYPELTPSEKLEFKNTIERYVLMIEKIYYVLYSIDPKKTMQLRKRLDNAIDTCSLKDESN